MGRREDDMTCIVGIETRDGVVMGGDSCTSDGYSLHSMAGAKVFRVGRYVFGVAGSGRVSDLVRYAVALPDPPQRGLHRFLVRLVVPLLRKAASKGGHMLIGSPAHSDGPGGGDALDSAILVGVRGRLFTIGGDFCVDDHREGYTAAGSGAMVALGSLHSTAGRAPRTRVRMALEAAEAHAEGVRRPFRIVTGR